MMLTVLRIMLRKRNISNDRVRGTLPSILGNIMDFPYGKLKARLTFPLKTTKDEVNAILFTAKLQTSRNEESLRGLKIIIDN